MGEYERSQKEINRLRIRQTKSRKLSEARGTLREMKYGKYFKPGRKIVGWTKKQVSDSGGFGGMNISNPLEDIGDGFGGISMGNPFGESERTYRKHRKKHKRIVYHRKHSKPQYIILRR